MRKAALTGAGIILALSATAGDRMVILEQYRDLQQRQEAVERYQEQLREEWLTDSLLSSITIDSLTRDTYSKFAPSLNAPLTIDGFPEESPADRIEAPNFARTVGVVYAPNDTTTEIIHPAPATPLLGNPVPEWMEKSLRFKTQIRNARLRMMLNDPSTIEYTDWDLPTPPPIYYPDFSFHGYLRRLTLPELPQAETPKPEGEIKRRNWLHYFNVSLQVSQAYVSPNWYQGGNSNLAGLFNFTWNVNLNENFHPKLLFQSSLEYKLAVNSNPKGSLHKYNTSQDLFQYTLKTGLKAFNHWFYSLNLLFNTQLFNAYPDDSMQRSSTLLSPGTLNLGVGMTYTLTKNGLSMTASISPLAYNLKTCLASDIDHEQFNIKPNRKTVSEVGSSAEVNLTWNFNSNISWKSRLFLFTDYKYFLADWENTLNFQINKLLSTQIFLHPRLDTSTETDGKWKHFMLHEILSFGISYTFATPK